MGLRQRPAGRRGTLSRSGAQGSPRFHPLTGCGRRSLTEASFGASVPENGVSGRFWFTHGCAFGTCAPPRRSFIHMGTRWPLISPRPCRACVSTSPTATAGSDISSPVSGVRRRCFGWFPGACPAPQSRTSASHRQTHFGRRGSHRYVRRSRSRTHPGRRSRHRNCAWRGARSLSCDAGFSWGRLYSFACRCYPVVDPA